MSRVRRGLVALVNDAAGSAERDRVAAACDVLRAAGEVDVAATADEDDVDAVIADLDERLLVVFGGDGSLHLAVERLDAAGQLAATTLALVPLGTGNDLARGLGIPLDPLDAAETIVTGRDRRLDLLRYEGGVCINAMHAGVGVDAAQRSADLKERMGALAYPLGALAAGVSAAGWALDVRADGEPLATAAEPLLLLAIANGPSFGGGTRIAPVADPGDGRLDVVVVGALAPGPRTAFAAALAGGQHLERDDVVHRQVDEVVVRGQAVRWNIDGELPADEVTERRVVCEASAWSLRVPADGRAG